MTAIHFFADGVRLSEAQLPTVPRVGEMIAMKNPFRTFQVEQVAWDKVDDEAIARVHLVETRHFFKS
ncbi:MAG TPA: hypothetical protein VGY55_05680 [Pirellulales bacterium]|jgi:hypothetical protein|nr:hypothetical protein [Pirellulales bacterium]